MDVHIPTAISVWAIVYFFFFVYAAQLGLRVMKILLRHKKRTFYGHFRLSHDIDALKRNFWQSQWGVAVLSLFHCD